MKSITSFLVVLIPLIAFSQKTFAPLNAVWNYEATSEFNGTILACEGNHYKYIVEEELLIDGKDCSLVKAYHSTNIDTVWRDTGDSLVVYEDGQKIFFLQDSSFLLLFDFGAELGDTIIRYDPYKKGAFSGTGNQDSTLMSTKMEMYISDISSREIQGVSYKIQTMTGLASASWFYQDEILEGIGSLSESFSGNYLNTIANGCNGELICYSDQTIEYETPNSFAPAHPDCGYSPILDNIEDYEPLKFHIYPNPFQSRLNVEIDTENISLQILDINGRVVIKERDQKYLNTESLTPGIYILQIFNNELIQSVKVIKY